MGFAARPVEVPLVVFLSIPFLRQNKPLVLKTIEMSQKAVTQ